MSRATLLDGLVDRLSSLSVSNLAVKPTSLPSEFFKIPPAREPAVLPPPTNHPITNYPFTIPVDLYNDLLSVKVPIVIGFTYAVIATYMNIVNKRRGYKPWSISRTRGFKWFVILHNLFLAVYSAWTFVGMAYAVRASVPSWEDGGLAGQVDALCKINGPRGYGHAVAYNTTTKVWKFTNRALHLAADGLTPDSTDVGRIWNEGLAFYGWLFYLSKFYEVIDTAIILAKGKKSSFLQTYHHTGAMFCMWTGIRYMSPPIWMFVLVNSFIHTIMYSFYLCSVIGVKVPKGFKRTLTTMQISQFVIGATYAFAHLFVAYKIPVAVPYLHNLTDAVSSALQAVPSDASSVVSSAVATASAGLSAWLKKAAFRAAGREGLAEKVLNDHGQTFGIDTARTAKDFIAKEEIRFREELQWVHCLDTSGQVFAILLNCVYLLPLTGLFVRFFIKAYLRQVERRRSSTAGEYAKIARKSLTDASRGISREVNGAVEEMQAISEDIGEDNPVLDTEALMREAQKVNENAQRKIQEGIDKAKELPSKVDTEKLKQEVKGDLEKLRQSIKEKAEQARQQSSSTISSSKSTSKSSSSTTSTRTTTTSSNTQEQISKTASDVKENVIQSAIKISEKIEDSDLFSKEARELMREKANQGLSTVKETASDTAEWIKQETNERSPNDVGTSAGEATGQSQRHQAQSSVTETTEEKAEKKEEDKIIDESQLVRDKDVDA